MPQPTNRLFLATLLLICTTACLAESADRDKPLNLESDQMLIDDAQQTSTFTGNVRLTQGTMLIRGDKIVVVQDKDGFKHGTVYGHTASFLQKREGLDEYMEGYGERIEYDTRAETIDFYIQARVKRKLDEVRGEHITYNVKTETFQVGSDTTAPAGSPPKRVHAVLQPKPKVGSPPKITPDALPVTPAAPTSPRSEK